MDLKNACIFSSVEGHLSIAQSVAGTLKTEFQPVIYTKRDRMYDLYMPIYQFFPGLYKYPFRLAKREKTLKVIQTFLKRKYRTELNTFFQHHQPALCISTYFGYNPVLEELCEEKHIPFLNILTDPRSIHPLLIAEHAVNVMFDEYAIEHCKKFFPQARYTKMGWFVRDEYQQSYDQQRVREKLKLDSNQFTILLASGSEGTNVVTKILPGLLTVKKPLQLIIACGDNTVLYQSAKALGSYLRKTQSIHSVIALKFTKELYLYMQAADLVVGKAGPNTLFESVATHTPFFAITHIAGQEDGNLDIIREYELGYVEENTAKAVRLLKKIVTDPKQLEKFQPKLHKMAEYNRAAPEQLRALTASL